MTMMRVATAAAWRVGGTSLCHRTYCVTAAAEVVATTEKMHYISSSPTDKIIGDDDNDTSRLLSSVKAIPQHLPRRIVFGSCSDQNVTERLCYWDRFIDQHPDLVILMGDNIYCGDDENQGKTEEGKKVTNDETTEKKDIGEDILHAAYRKFAAHPSVQRGFSELSVIATMDDNDYYRYGKEDSDDKNDNNSDKSPMHSNRRENSKKQFLDFFQVDNNDGTGDDRRNAGRGVYTSYRWGNALQIILLDCRYHADPFLRATETTAVNNHGGDSRKIYQNNSYSRDADSYRYDSDARSKRTLLGDEQWAWLEEQVASFGTNNTGTIDDKNVTDIGGLNPAQEGYKNNEDSSSHRQLRLVVSSIQVLPETNGWDGWCLLPHEQKRLLDLIHHHDNIISKNNCQTIFLSGDRHFAGMYNKEYDENTTALFWNQNQHQRLVYEITSSSLTHSAPWEILQSLQHDDCNADLIHDNNFGVLDIDWSLGLLEASIRDCDSGKICQPPLTSVVTNPLRISF